MAAISQTVLKPKDSRAFEVDCTASPVGSFRTGADSLSVTIGQRIRRLGGEEMWDSVIAQCREEGNELTVRVLVCNPDWDGPLQIACIRSELPGEGPLKSGGSLRCSLEQVKT